MIGADYIANLLAEFGVTDVFGVPGGVVLDLLYAFELNKNIEPHLCYHEQAAGFAACGYAQVKGLLGVAYTTKGPGFTNLITSIADAYCDSIPVLFITAHTTELECEMRVETNQELDTCSMVRSITKFCSRVDSIEELPVLLKTACMTAICNRKGPVFLDIKSSLFNQNVSELSELVFKCRMLDVDSHDALSVCNIIKRELHFSKCPVILIGDGINQTNLQDYFKRFISNVCIPIISSRTSHNIAGSSNFYFGYIGSHGIRVANMILAKADLVISIGNRCAFPVKSESYCDLFTKTRLLRIDIDKSEFKRSIPNSINCIVDINKLLPVLAEESYENLDYTDWLNLCNGIRERFYRKDINIVVETISVILESAIGKDITIVSDVGNCEFWLSRACVLARSDIRVLYSNSMGSLGNSLCKSVGVYYATKKPVICFVGDQGFQFNIQELQTISQNSCPIKIVLLNNKVSGMIKDRELQNDRKELHTTSSSGYGIPDFNSIVRGYGIPVKKSINFDEALPSFLNMEIDENLRLYPILPKGNSIEDMFPYL